MFSNDHWSRGMKTLGMRVGPGGVIVMCSTPGPLGILLEVSYQCEGGGGGDQYP